MNKTLPPCTSSPSMTSVAMMRALLLVLGVVCAIGGPTIAAAAPVQWSGDGGSTMGGFFASEDRRGSRESVLGNSFQKVGDWKIPKPWLSGFFLVRKNQPTSFHRAKKVVGSVNVDITMQAQKMALQNRYGNGKTNI